MNLETGYMVQSDKYYKASLEDIKVGAEIFFIKDLNKGYEKDNLQKLEPLSPKNVSFILYTPWRWNEEVTEDVPPNLDSYIIKYLDREDIEREGWKLIDKQNNWYSKGEFVLIFKKSKPSIQIADINSSWGHQILFDGFCKSINEFKLICKILGI